MLLTPPNTDDLDKVRFQVSLTEEIIAESKLLAKRGSVTVSALIRYAVADYFKKDNESRQAVGIVWRAQPYHTPSKTMVLELPLWLKNQIQAQSQQLDVKMSEFVREVLKIYIKKHSRNHQ